MARKRNKIGKRAWIGLAVLGVVMWLTLGHSAIGLVIVAFLIGFIVFAQFVIGPILMRSLHHSRTTDQLRMTDAVGDALRDYAPQQPSRPSMSARLDDLTAAFQSGRITEDEYNRVRASIIQSS
jgi:hypothetical protein